MTADFVTYFALIMFIFITHGVSSNVVVCDNPMAMCQGDCIEMTVTGNTIIGSVGCLVTSLQSAYYDNMI